MKKKNTCHWTCQLTQQSDYDGTEDVWTQWSWQTLLKKDSCVILQWRAGPPLLWLQSPKNKHYCPCPIVSPHYSYFDVGSPSTKRNSGDMFLAQLKVFKRNFNINNVLSKKFQKCDEIIIFLYLILLPPIMKSLYCSCVFGHFMCEHADETIFFSFFVFFVTLLYMLCFPGDLYKVNQRISPKIES